MSALLTDLYQVTMLQAYLDEGMQREATFELFVRKLPPQRNFLVAAGLEQALQFLETLAFTVDEIAWVERQGSFKPALLGHLRTLRFTGDVHAMPDGTVFFGDEPILRVTAPLPLAQLVEARLLVDFGMRRARPTWPASTARRPGRRRACTACWPGVRGGAPRAGAATGRRCRGFRPTRWAPQPSATCSRSGRRVGRAARPTTYASGSRAGW